MKYGTRVGRSHGYEPFRPFSLTSTCRYYELGDILALARDSDQLERRERREIGGKDRIVQLDKTGSLFNRTTNRTTHGPLLLHIGRPNSLLSYLAAAWLPIKEKI